MRRLSLLGLLTLTAALAPACGEVTSFPDAGGGGDDAIDAQSAIDATTADAREIGPVNVTVLNTDGDGQPVQGATVVFVQPDGTTSERKLTDGAGKASAEIHIGASVTVIRFGADGADLTTILDVAPDDELVFGQTGAVALPFNGEMTVNFTPHPKAQVFYKSVGCGSGGFVDFGTTTTVTIGNCPTPNHDFTMVAIAPGGNGYAVAHLDNQPFASGGTVTLPNDWTRFPQFTASYSNLPPTVTSISAQHRAYTATDHFGYYSTNGQSIPITGATATAAFTVPANIGESRLTSTFQRTGFEQQTVAARLTGTSFGLDVGAELLPWVTFPAVDVPSQTIAWATEGDNPYDGVFVELGITRPPAQAGGQYLYYKWRVISPPVATSLKLPVLPAEVGDLRILPTDTASALVFLIDVSDHPDYASFRQTAEPDRYETASNQYSRFQRVRVSGGNSRD